MTMGSSMMFILAQAVKPAEVAEPSLFSPWIIFMFVVLVVALPFVLGTVIARSLKMKDLALKISVVLLAMELGLAPMLSQYVIGSREQSHFAKEDTHWKDKDESRQKISKTQIAEFKSAIPGVEVVEHQEPSD
jgi:hypothetical protein